MMTMRMNQIDMNNGVAAYSGRTQPMTTGLGRLIGDAAAMITLWQSRRRDRRAVGRLDDHMLRDIGVDRFTAEQIGGRPFWKA